MKKKKLFVLTSAALSAILLSSCSTASITGFSSNWYANTAIPTVVEGTSETLSYAVSMKPDSSYNNVYSVLYSNGTYTTTLAAEMHEGELIYSYQIRFTISVQYTFQSETSELFTDVLTSKVRFKNAQAGLRPVYSEREVESHSPSGPTPKSIEDTYRHYHYKVVTEYPDASSGKSTFTNLDPDNPSEDIKEFSVSDKYSFVDADQLLFAVRGMEFTSAHEIRTFSFARSTKKEETTPVKISPSGEASDEFSFKMNGKDVKAPIAYYPVTIAYQVKLPGGAQTAWYAKTTDPTANTYRNVMLKYEKPIDYSLGTLVYTLTSADFADA